MDYFKKNFVKPLSVAALIVFLAGCAPLEISHQSHNIADNHGEKVMQLRQDLEGLLSSRDESAFLLARAALDGSRNLAQNYRVSPPARLHNFLVQLGMKERGLCCHWTQDLLSVLKKVDQQQFGFYWAVSSYGTIFEHSSLVVVAAGRVFGSGIVLDPWRYSGDLYWAPVLSDSYRWQPHPLYTHTSILECADNLK